MSKTNGYLTSLPREIGHGIAALISPLSRASLGRAFAKGSNIFNLTTTQKRSARVWDMMFKDESWFQAIDDLKYDRTSLPNPTLIGYDLTKLYDGSFTSAYIALLVSDWDNGCRSFKRKLFASLREHDYDKQTFEVRFKNGIILNIRDAITSTEDIEMEDPRRLFRCRKQKLKTAALYYKDENLHKIGSDKIGKVIDMPKKEKKCVEHICSIRLKFGDGMPVYRVIKRHNIPIRLVNIQTTDENGEEWVTSWRLARVDEPEWWP
ncbi:hypothetical protein B0J14DRAFT_567112 [Halenospora varia]|nr:hypothetical protein B0J14DRAFT_567112 [Halenospora varia]